MPASSRAAATRARLLAAARDELIERDGQLEVDSVARRADASVGIIYRHFGNRAGLIGAVVDDFYARFRAEAMEINPAPGGTVVERERRRIELAVAFHYADPLARVILQSLHLDAEVAAMEARHRAEMVRLATAVVSLGQRRREVPADRDPAFVAAMVIGGMREVLASSFTGRRVAQATVARKLWVLVAAVIGVEP